MALLLTLAALLAFGCGAPDNDDLPPQVAELCDAFSVQCEIRPKCQNQAKGSYDGEIVCLRENVCTPEPSPLCEIVTLHEIGHSLFLDETGAFCFAAQEASEPARQAGLDSQRCGTTPLRESCQALVLCAP